MTTRKGQALGNKHNLKANGKGSEEYEVNYYGDETFLRIDAFENEKNNLEAKISGLEWKNTALIILGVVQFFLLIATIAFSIVLHQNVENLQNSQSGIKVRFEDEPSLQNKDELSLQNSFKSDFEKLEKRMKANLVLRGGDSWSNGNVFINGGPVCDDEWAVNNNNAKVVCTSLGFRQVLK